MKNLLDGERFSITRYGKIEEKYLIDNVDEERLLNKKMKILKISNMQNTY